MSWFILFILVLLGGFGNIVANNYRAKVDATPVFEDEEEEKIYKSLATLASLPQLAAFCFIIYQIYLNLV
jgi:hypothetical protein